MSEYEELVKRCGGGIVVRAILDEVFRTLETVTSEMRKGGLKNYGRLQEDVFLAMLRASPLAKPKEDAP